MASRGTWLYGALKGGDLGLFLHFEGQISAYGCAGTRTATQHVGSLQHVYGNAHGYAFSAHMNNP